MNCKQGDLARIVGPFPADVDGRFLGWIVLCVEPTVSRLGAPGWVVDPPVPGWRGVKDEHLRPIRDPGEDAVDEFARPRDDARELMAPKPQREFSR